MDFEIRRLQPGDEEAVAVAGFLFDHPPEAEATRRFLSERTHYLLMAYDSAGAPIGFVSGMETTHPDKGTEMFLNELSVDPPVRRRGVGRKLVEALAEAARGAGCYDMWTLADDDDTPAIATYVRAGGREGSHPVMIEWEFR